MGKKLLSVSIFGLFFFLGVGSGFGQGCSVKPTAIISGATTICSGNSATLTITGTANAIVTYNDGSATTQTTLDSSGKRSITLNNITATTTINLVQAWMSTCTSKKEDLNSSAVITVTPNPIVTKPPDRTVCAGETVTAINFSGSSVSGTTYQWTNNNTAIGLAASGTGNIPAFSATNTTNASITANITVTPVANNCSGTPQTFSITVNPSATVTKPADKSFCAGENVPTINFSGSSISGTTYNWTNNNTAIGLGASGTGNISSFSASNNTNAPITANITVTPVANNCDGTPQTFSITVNPTATVTKPSVQTICNEETVSAINFSGSNVSGTSYQWTNDNTTIGLAGSGTGNIASFTGTNNTNAPITANITVTPVANNCDGTPQTFSITVNPTATVTKPSDQIVGNAGTVSAKDFTGSNVTGTTYKWSNDNTSIGLAASGTGNIESFNGTNNTNAPITANITVTPIANSCDGIPQTFSIIVNPTATVTKPSDQTVCNGAAVSAINFSGSNVTGTTYKWSNDNTAIGLAATGTGNIASFTGTNNSNAPITANITVTPIANNCDGTPQTFSITVNPTATVTKPSEQIVCNAGTVSAINFTGSNVTGTTYKWRNDNTAIGLAASGTGNISSFIGTNSNNTPITANITVTPVANNCDGTPQTFSITINPSTTVDAGAPQIICSNGTISLAGSITGGTTSGTWSAPSGTFSNANSLTTTYTPGITSGTVTLTLTSEDSDGAGPCTVVTDTVEITVFEKVEILQDPIDVTICSANRVEFTVDATGDGLTYQWFKRARDGAEIIPGATSEKLFFASVAYEDQGTYFVEVSGTSPCTKVVSEDAKLIVDLNIVVNTHPQSKEVCIGENVTLTVDANYQKWFS
ncbi:hypothetical protein FHG64_13560 [Antarcticibacterium flavum]|uniref:Ig-like domain-containing protein n=1 Tax=Antarcticibacterium flavum TaxID=2058175 RepID=A0A5B7X6M1_9FLAO|nr:MULTISPECIES: PKD-like domain-containing protein [Antarcticibacterium]MCM4160066.1 hypothetical protein [Antarcticibacterium sp. W02-3]QCY70348.1 hypothetical protein FHG64_13560 [Antarcticibacterium flavum]